MDGFRSNQGTPAFDRWMEIVNGKGYGVGPTQLYSTRPGSPDFKQSIPPPPGSFTAPPRANAPWRFMDAETKRKRRIAAYKVYAMEGKVKSTVKKGYRWIKNRCSQLVQG